MVGLLPKNKIILQKWYKLFFAHKEIRSIQAYLHWQHLNKIGLSSNQDKEWKSLPLDAWLSRQFVFINPCSISISVINKLSLKINAYRLVFIDGIFIPILSDNNIGFWKITIENGIKRKPLQAPIRPELFLHLTESLNTQISRIHLPNGKLSSKPLYLLHLSNSIENNDDLSMTHYRHHLDIGDNSHGLVIEHFASLSSYAHFTGSRTSINVANNSHFHYIKLIFENCNNYHFSHNDIHVGHHATVYNSTFILNTNFSKHHTSVQLNNKNSNLTMNSLLMPNKQNVNCIDSYVQHNDMYCLSKQLHKIIASDHATGIYKGLVKVTKYASKTDACIISNNLLLDTLSQVNVSPQMQIYTDDVKCKHAITIGYLDEEQIFYLRSRGIAIKNVQKMMIYAFAVDMVETISDDNICKNILSFITAHLKEF